MRHQALTRKLSVGLLACLCGVFTVPLWAQANNNQSHHAELLVINQRDYTLDLIDPVSGRILGTVPTGNNQGHGHEVVASPDGRTAYVPIYGNTGVGRPGTNGNKMLVIDLPSQKVTGIVHFGHGDRPHCPVFDRKRNVLYVSTELDQAISIVDPRALKVIGTIPTGQPESHMFVLSHDGRRGYTANVGPGTVSALDMENRKLLKVIRISPTTQRISISRDNSLVFTSDQTKPALDVINTHNLKLQAPVPLPAVGYGTASTLDGRWLLVAMPKANQVAVVNLRSMKVAHTVDVCGSPQEILMQPDNSSIAYISCMGTGNVAVVNLNDWKMQRTIRAGRGADGLAWAR